jgi:hypothetical protein
MSRESFLPEADREFIAGVVKGSDDRAAKRFDQIDRRLTGIDKRLDESDKRQRELAEAQTKAERDSVVEGIEAERDKAEIWARIGEFAGAKAGTKAGTAAGTEAGALAGADAAVATNRKWSAIVGVILAVTSLINWWVASHPTPPALPPHLDRGLHVPTPTIGP